jgi:very-short-patch-repair endonuclease
MTWPIVFLALCLIVVIAFKTLERPPKASDWPVHARAPLSRAEQVLYWRLCEAFPDHIVLAQVAIAQLLEVENVANRRAVFNRYRQLVADFVVCTRAFGVVAVIELDDRSHQNPGRADADARKSAALGAAGLLLLRFNVRSLPTSGELRSQLANPAMPVAETPAVTASAAQRRPAAA